MRRDVRKHYLRRVGVAHSDAGDGSSRFDFDLCSPAAEHLAAAGAAAEQTEPPTTCGSSPSDAARSCSSAPSGSDRAAAPLTPIKSADAAPGAVGKSPSAPEVVDLEKVAVIGRARGLPENRRVDTWQRLLGILPRQRSADAYVIGARRAHFAALRDGLVPIYRRTNIECNEEVTTDDLVHMYAMESGQYPLLVQAAALDTEFAGWSFDVDLRPLRHLTEALLHGVCAGNAVDAYWLVKDFAGEKMLKMSDASVCALAALTVQLVTNADTHLAHVLAPPASGAEKKSSVPLRGADASPLPWALWFRSALAPLLHWRAAAVMWDRVVCGAPVAMAYCLCELLLAVAEHILTFVSVQTCQLEASYSYGATKSAFPTRSFDAESLGAEICSTLCSLSVDFQLSKVQHGLQYWQQAGAPCAPLRNWLQANGGAASAPPLSPLKKGAK